MKSSRDWIILLHSLFLCLAVCPVASKQCTYNRANGIKTKETNYDMIENVNFTEDGAVEKCRHENDFCFTLLIENLNKSYIVESQGCWRNKGSTDCKSSNCVAAKAAKAKNDSKFCCCSADLCNQNYTVINRETVSADSNVSIFGFDSVEHAASTTKTSTIALACTFSLAVIGVAIFVFFRLCCFNRKSNTDSVQRIISPPPNQAFDIDKLTIEKMIGKGKYGSVHLGRMEENKVAVKIFNQENEQYFRNENDVYSLPFMDHPCLVKFLGAKERTDDLGKTEYLLVLSYSSNGCLQDYLRHHTVNWSSLCEISQNLTSGLAYLHTAVIKKNELKPCIAHRDLTSRNVLIRNDGGCMICDFGFATCLQQGKYYRNGELRVAETTPLADVGTLRYMAPEVLEGAVNLTDCETSLKQADVYALGLILWEIASRCTDLYRGLEVPEYKLPFERELNGQKPSMEQMQVLVAQNKARPLFPDIWKDTNPAIKELKETIEYCWDQDADARLTTEGVLERLTELPKHWESHKANISCVSPIVNITKTSYQSLPSSSNIVINIPESDISMEACQQDSNSDSNLGTRENSENTLETIVTTSPSESNVTPLMPKCIKNSAARNSNSSLITELSVPLQPHHGYNPSMERNLLKVSEKDTICSDNVLLEKVYKDDKTMNQHSKNIMYQNHTDDNSATSNDTFEQVNRICHPIPYVQNVHIITTIPNQNTLDNKNFNSLFNCKQERKRKRNQGTRSRLKGFFERKRTSKEQILEEERQPLKASTSNELWAKRSREEEATNNVHPDTEKVGIKLSHYNVDLHKDLHRKISLDNLSHDSQMLSRTKSKEYLSFSVYNHTLTNGIK